MNAPRLTLIALLSLPLAACGAGSVVPQTGIAPRPPVPRPAPLASPAR
nr:hypothetical protein [Sphingobium xenophagum]